MDQEFRGQRIGKAFIDLAHDFQKSLNREVRDIHGQKLIKLLGGAQFQMTIILIILVLTDIVMIAVVLMVILLMS